MGKSSSCNVAKDVNKHATVKKLSTLRLPFDLFRSEGLVVSVNTSELLRLFLNVAVNVLNGGLKINTVKKMSIQASITHIPHTSFSI